MNAHQRFFALGATALGVAILSACVVAPAHYRPIAAGGPVTSDFTVTYAPPAAQIEIIPAQPRSGAVWINGYWGWSNNRHQWIPGRWDAPPAGRAHWQAHQWVMVPGRGWVLQHGYWR